MLLFLFFVVGLYGVIKNNARAQIAFDICLLPAWHVGTLIGGISLLFFFLRNKKCTQNAQIKAN